MIDIRSATVADVPFLAAAQAPEHAHGFVLPASEAEICAALDRADRSTFVIEEDAMPAGMILLAYDPPSPWIVEFRRIIVTRPGLGIGFAAVRWVVGWSFGKLGAHRIWLDVLESNARARALYERAGFRYEGTSRDGFRNEDGTYANLCLYGLLRTDPSVSFDTLTGER